MPVADTSQQLEFMQEAVRLALESVESGGGPFGAVVVRDGQVIGRGSNRVTVSNDPTAHAEVMAIRDACNRVGDFRLVGAQLYVSCEPCPMCLAAAYWAHVDRIYFAASREDAAAAGFDDEVIYREVCLPPSDRAVTMQRLLPDIGRQPFVAWRSKQDRIDY